MELLANRKRANAKLCEAIVTLFVHGSSRALGRPVTLHEGLPLGSRVLPPIAPGHSFSGRV